MGRCIADFENDILRLTFKIGKEETESFKYIGLGINQCEDNIIDQESYINHLKLIDVSTDRKSADSPSTDKERDLLRSKIDSYFGRIARQDQISATVLVNWQED